MKSIEVRNVNEALPAGLQYLWEEGERETSRNGPVVVAPGPVCTIYLHPTERVLFSPVRDANPYFHFMEALWMLSGSNETEFPCRFNKGYNQFSDDGKTMWDAYGWRWRKFFGWDQLEAIAKELRANPSSRRCVLAMWNAWPNAGDYDQNRTDFTIEHDELASHDFYVATHGGKAVPCNTHAYFDCRHGVLNMTVLCRSNDIVWGAYGANAVHFSMLQELMAAWVGVPVGVYSQVSNNYHLYPDNLGGEARWKEMAGLPPWPPVLDPYTQFIRLKPYPMVKSGAPVETWLEELNCFMADPVDLAGFPYTEPFFPDVAVPLYRSWTARKEKRGTGLQELEDCKASDWKLAATEWIQRREAKKAGGA